MEIDNLSFLAKKLVIRIVVSVLLVSLVFGIGGEGSYVCQGKCEDITDCSSFCKRAGYGSGNCVPPLYQYCCCKILKLEQQILSERNKQLNYEDMASFKQIGTKKLCKSIPAGVAAVKNAPRSFVTATRPLQKGKTDKEVQETCEEVSEAAGVVKESAKVITKVTKEVGGKISKGADEFVNEAKDAIIKPAKEKISETAQEKIKDKIVGK